MITNATHWSHVMNSFENLLSFPSSKKGASKVASSSARGFRSTGIETTAMLHKSRALGVLFSIYWTNPRHMFCHGNQFLAHTKTGDVFVLISSFVTQYRCKATKHTLWRLFFSKITKKISPTQCLEFDLEPKIAFEIPVFDLAVFWKSSSYQNLK